MPEDYRQLPPLSPRQIGDPEKLDEIDQIMQAVAGNRKRVPHIAEFIEHLVEAFGGARQLAGAFYDEYKKASSVHFKGRMLESVVRLMQVHASQAGPQEEMSALSDAELRSVAASLLGPFYATQKEAARLNARSGGQEAADTPAS